jgi:hypothetical protein
MWYLNLAGEYQVEIRTTNGLNELVVDRFKIVLINPCSKTPILNTFNKELVIPRLGSPFTMSYTDTTLPPNFLVLNGPVLIVALNKKVFILQAELQLLFMIMGSRLLLHR